jgi:endonuclease IV
MGIETFARIVNDRRFRGLPLVVETPGPLSEWKKEIARLRALVRPEGKRRGARAPGSRKRR